MPESSYFNRRPIINIFSDLVKSQGLKDIDVLDLGIGYGNFGKFIKNKVPANIKFTGVEVWEKYRNKNWEYYDKIIINDVRDYIKGEKKKFDVVLFIDILEHFNQSDGIKILKRLKDMTRKILILSTPVTDYPQGPEKGNPHQEHKYFWSEKELTELGFRRICSRWTPTFSLWPLFSKLGIYVFKNFSYK